MAPTWTDRPLPIEHVPPSRRAAFADVIGIDMLSGPGVDCVLNLEEPLPADLVGAFGLLRVVNNIDEVTLKGAELSFNYRVTDEFRLSGG